MSFSFGNKVKVSIFGESHGEAIGATIEGIDAGEKIDISKLKKFLSRRLPGKNNLSTPRIEKDEPLFLSGLRNSITTGSPITVIIKNCDVKSREYESFEYLPRPGHADFPAYIKYKGFNDKRGGGSFSGRLTAALCVAGGISLQILNKKNIYIGAHIYSIKNIYDDKFDPVLLNSDDLINITNKDFPVLNDGIQESMKNEILNAKKEGDSVGGIVECGIVGLPIGVGEPMFSGIENKISQAVFGIPAIKGIEFGAGFESTLMYGSENNDEYMLKNKNISTLSNNSGGILGGLSTGMPVLFKVAVKPTPSISKKQNTVDLNKLENAKIEIKGRHDPCIVPRVVPCIESATAISILDMIYK